MRNRLYLSVFRPGVCRLGARPPGTARGRDPTWLAGPGRRRRGGAARGHRRSVSAGQRRDVCHALGQPETGAGVCNRHKRHDRHDDPDL